MTRHEARAAALELLFEYDFNPEKTTEDIINSACENRELKKNEFTEALFKFAAENINKADELIKASAKNWSFERISKISKAVLRLAITEILYGTPVNIAINEAVELEKEYDDETGAAFVNGVLGAIVRSPKYKEYVETDKEEKVENNE